MLDTHHVLTPEFTEVIFSCLRINPQKNSDWEYYFSGFYVEFTPVGLLLPDDGWKLRVNTLIEEAVQTLKSVIPICADRNLAFKVLGDPDIYLYAHSKQMEPSSAGKFLTCYLPTESELVEVAHLFDEAISREGLSPAAHPISDQRLSANLSYRYGSFTVDALVKGVPDCREYFKLPPCVTTDPFTGECEEAAAVPSDGVVIGNYRIETLLHRTYASAVYQGTRLGEEKPIVLKEVRPYTIVNGIAAKTRLENEYVILKAIADTEDCAGICPAPLELFEIDGYGFLAMTEIEAVSLYEWMQQQKQGQHEYLRIGIKVAELILKLHTHGISWNDLHPSNLLINVATQRLYLIDAEFAMMPASDFRIDLQMLGKLLLWLAFSGEADGLWEHDGCPDIFLQKLKQDGNDGNDRNEYCAAIDLALSPETADVLPILKILTRKHS